MIFVQCLMLMICSFAIPAPAEVKTYEKPRVFECPNETCHEVLFQSYECSWIIPKGTCLCHHPDQCDREIRYHTWCNKFDCQPKIITTTPTPDRLRLPVTILSILSAILGMVIFVGLLVVLWRNRVSLANRYRHFRDRERRER